MRRHDGPGTEETRIEDLFVVQDRLAVGDSSLGRRGSDRPAGLGKDGNTRRNGGRQSHAKIKDDAKMAREMVHIVG